MELLLGIGGNEGDVEVRFAAALRCLDREVGVRRCSQLYRTEAVGPAQPHFFNMAVLVELDRSLAAMLTRCQELEADAGRDRTREPRWGPRPLDLDLLIAPHVVRRGSRIELPHPRLRERAFALVPAAELCPDWQHPLVGRTLAELADQALAAAPDAVELVGTLEA